MRKTKQREVTKRTHIKLIWPDIFWEMIIECIQLEIPEPLKMKDKEYLGTTKALIQRNKMKNYQKIQNGKIKINKIKQWKYMECMN